LASGCSGETSDGRRYFEPHAEARVKIAEVHDEVAAVLADTRMALRLDVRLGTVIPIRRIYFTPGEEPVNLTILSTPSDRYRMSVRLRNETFEYPDYLIPAAGTNIGGPAQLKTPRGPPKRWTFTLVAEAVA
jgi:hypothetical protein